MGEDSDLEMTLEDEVTEDEIIVVEDKKGVVVPPTANGGINDPYWKKWRLLFHPTMGIDGMLSVEQTIKASIALLFEVDDYVFQGSLFVRLQEAVVSGAAHLTKDHLGNESKRTAYYALTTMHGYGIFPRGFVYLSINLLGDDRSKIRKALEPLKKLSNAMNGQLTHISKCGEKRVSKNKELHDKCVKMQSMVDRRTLWQYPLLFEGGHTWPAFVNSSIREHEEGELNKVTKEEFEKMKEDKYSYEREEKLKGKMANLQSGHFWMSNTTIWGLNTEVDGSKVVDTAILFIKELNSRLYGGQLLEKVRSINGKTIPLEDRNVFDRTRQHCLRFLEIIERYAVFPKGIATLILTAILRDESVLSPIMDLLRKVVAPVEKNINHMVELSSLHVSGKIVEKDAQVAVTLNNLRTLAKNEIYPHLPSVFASLKCTRVPAFVAEWMKQSPMTKSSISEWSANMGVHTDLNGFPLKNNEEFVMPEMADEYLVEEEEKKKRREKEKKKKGGGGGGGSEDKSGVKKEQSITAKKEKTEKVKKDTPFRRPIPMVHPDSKPVSLLDQVISNPFAYPRMGPPPANSVIGGPMHPFGSPPSIMGPPPGMGPMGMAPTFIGGPLPGIAPPGMPPFPGGVFPSASGLPGLFDIPMDRCAPPFIEIGGPTTTTPDISRPPPNVEEEEERRKLEKMARLVMGAGQRRGGEEEERGEKRERRSEEEMNERERRLQRWLQEKNGGRRREDGRDGRDQRQRRSRSRSREKERERDGRGDFERRVEELERKRREEREEKERIIKEYCVEHWRKVKGSFKPMDESKWEFRPEWGVTTVWRRVSGHSRWEEKVKDKLDLLTVKIKDHFVNNVQTPEDEAKKKLVLDRLQDGIQMKLDGTGVFFLMAGSTPSSFASRNSNLDLVLISPVPNMTPEHIRDIFFPDLPYLIMQRGGRITRQEALWMGFECTMAGNPLGVRIAIDSGAYYFSKIMSIYDLVDKRVSALLHYIKHWTATHLRRADDISKYLLTNLVIHYLQSGVSPPILPCLHLLYPARLTPDIFSSFDYVSPFDPPLPACGNTQSLASLFIGFLMYYASFDFSRYAISIRAGTVIRKRDLGMAVPEFAVEHPFDGSYSAVVNDPFTSSHFSAAMAAACQDAITTFDI